MAEPAPVEESTLEERRMPFLEHLQDLRTCLRNAAIGIFVGTLIAYIFRNELFALMANPFMEVLANTPTIGGPMKAELHINAVEEIFMVPLKLAILAGLFISSPVVFRELWRFISPGLYPRERRWGLGFVIASVVLFVGGGLFAYKFVLPAGFKFFLGFASDEWGTLNKVFGTSVEIKLSHAFVVKPMITMEKLFDITSMLLLVFGLVFELPLVLSILAMLGIVSAAQLWRWNRYAILVFTVLGAVLTPGDLVIGQLAMAGSLTVLYNLSIVLALVVQRPRKEEADAAT